jgi:hypothetical protein
MACGTVPVTAPLAGMPALLGELTGLLMAAEARPDTLATTIANSVPALQKLRQDVVARADEFSYARAAGRLMAAYSTIL